MKRKPTARTKYLSFAAIVVLLGLSGCGQSKTPLPPNPNVVGQWYGYLPSLTGPQALTLMTLKNNGKMLCTYFYPLHGPATVHGEYVVDNRILTTINENVHYGGQSHKLPRPTGNTASYLYTIENDRLQLSKIHKLNPSDPGANMSYTLDRVSRYSHS